MPKNKAQQRAKEKHQQEKIARRRARKMRTIRIWATVAGVVALALVLFLVFRDSGGGTVSPGSQPCPGAESKTCYDAAPPMTIDPAKTYTAAMTTTMGEVVIELNAKNAPKTVNNFVFLAREGFYDDIIFHRVIPGFMIQGGDPTGTGTSGPGYKFEDEVAPTDRFDKPGILAMANSGANTNGSQFFITVAPAEHLNGKHTIFGTVTKGMDVVSKIVSAERDAKDKPLKDIAITSITITEK